MLFKLLDWDNALRLIYGFIKNVDFKLYVYKHINKYIQNIYIYVCLRYINSGNPKNCTPILTDIEIFYFSSCTVWAILGWYQSMLEQLWV